MTPPEGVPPHAIDENWAAPIYGAPRLYFHRPNTACDRFEKLGHRKTDHKLSCANCGLTYVICAESRSDLSQPTLGEKVPRLAWLDRSAWLSFTVGLVLGFLLCWLVMRFHN